MMIPNFLLNIESSEYASFSLWDDFSRVGETVGFGARMLLLGLGTVFSVLILLWLCLIVFKIVFHDLPAKRAKAAVAPVAKETAEPVVEEQNDETEIIAVIAAAIAAAESECAGAKFRVVSFKRKINKTKGIEL